MSDLAMLPPPLPPSPPPPSLSDGNNGEEFNAVVSVVERALKRYNVALPFHAANLVISDNLLVAETNESVGQGALRLMAELPLGCTYTDTPPSFPQTGLYGFPSGSFDPCTDLGWKLKRTRTKYSRDRRDRLVQSVHLRCKKCRAPVTATIGPFVTILCVPAAQERHECD